VCSDGADVPLIVRKNHPGRGRAFYLNFAAPRAGELLAWLDGEGGPWAALPRIATLTPTPGEPGEYELVKLQRGKLSYLGVLHEHRFGLTEGPMTITLPQALGIYDVRAGEFLGRTDTITVDLGPGAAGVYAMLPYKVTGLPVVLPSRVQQGESCDISLTVEVSAGAPGDHVVRLEVRDPAGNLSEAYTRNFIAERGKASLTIPFALNDEPGAWRLHMKDIASGWDAAGQIVLTEPGE
jgi:hypothetical protein